MNTRKHKIKASEEKENKTMNKMTKKEAVKSANRTFMVQRLMGLLLVVLSLVAIPHMGGDVTVNVLACIAGTWFMFSKRMLLLNGNEAIFIEYGLIDENGKVL